MNWDTIEGQWKQLAGKARERWGKLTDDDWQRIAGKREELIGHVQQLYGRTREEAERDVAEWQRQL